MGTLTAGIKEIFSSAKTTGSNVMLCGNDGTPDGHMTMANLANVLGVVKRIDVTHTCYIELYRLDFTYWNSTSQGYRYCYFVVSNITGSVFCIGVAQEKEQSKISFGAQDGTYAYHDNDGNIYIRTGAYSPFTVYGYRILSFSFERVTDSVSLDTLTPIS